MNNRQPYRSRFNPHENNERCSGPDNCNAPNPYGHRRVIYTRITRTIVTAHDDTDSEESTEYDEAVPNDISPEVNGPALATQASTSNKAMQNADVDVTSDVTKDQPHDFRMEDEVERRVHVQETQTKNYSTTQPDTSKDPTEFSAIAPINAAKEQFYSFPTEDQAETGAHVQEAETKNYSTSQPDILKEPMKNVADAPINDAERQFHSLPIENPTEVGTDTKEVNVFAVPLGRDSRATDDSTSIINHAPVATSTPHTILCENSNCPALGSQENPPTAMTINSIANNQNRPGTSKQNETPCHKSVKPDLYLARPNVYQTTSISNTSRHFANEPVHYSRGPIRSEKIRPSRSYIIIRRVQTITTMTTTRGY